MASSTDLARLKARAEETERILATLQAQVESILKAAVKQAGQGEEEKLIRENEQLKAEIDLIRRELIVAEIGNGVRQVQMPSKGARAAFTLKLQSGSTPLVNGNALEQCSDASSVKAVAKESAVKKTKQAEQSAPAGGKKAKSDKQENKDKDVSSSKKVAFAGDTKSDESVDVSRLDLRVGKIESVEKHPDADTLYVEKVDLGEGHLRTVVSGLVKHYPLTAMKDRIAVFMCNLKPAKMRGVLSEGMIMCAVAPDKTEILVPPTDSVIGDRVTVTEYPGTPDEQLNPKKKIWETLKPDMKTTDDRIASYKGAHLMIPGKGVVLAPTLSNAQIS